jgi:23S rRNA (pseudouridine1915-N3)-methyltransferase
MKIKLFTIGKTDKKYFIQGIEEYSKRLIHYTKFESIIIPDIKKSKNLNQDLQKKLEGDLILKNISNQDFLILLDENGDIFSSVEFAKFIENQNLKSFKKIVFVIGGPYGFSNEIYNRANKKISLSMMTFSHQMVRLIFVEQLYRAFTIIKGEPYHHQ